MKFEVKRETISEKNNLVAVVDENDGAIVVGAFEDTDTANQVKNLLETLLRKISDKNYSSPAVTFRELCNSWADEENATLIKFGAKKIS